MKNLALWSLLLQTALPVQAAGQDCAKLEEYTKTIKEIEKKYLDLKKYREEKAIPEEADLEISKLILDKIDGNVLLNKQEESIKDLEEKQEERNHSIYFFTTSLAAFTILSRINYVSWKELPKNNSKYKNSFKKHIVAHFTKTKKVSHIASALFWMVSSAYGYISGKQLYSRHQQLQKIESKISALENLADISDTLDEYERTLEDILIRREILAESLQEEGVFCP